jgi:hypothetical protein
MTDTTLVPPVDEQIDLTLGGIVEIGITSSLNERTVYLHVEDGSAALTANDVLRIVRGLMRGVDAIGFPGPDEPVDAPAPVVVTRVIPGDDLIFVGMPR